MDEVQQLAFRVQRLEYAIEVAQTHLQELQNALESLRVNLHARDLEHSKFQSTIETKFENFQEVQTTSQTGRVPQYALVLGIISFAFTALTTLVGFLVQFIKFAPGVK